MTLHITPRANPVALGLMMLAALAAASLLYGYVQVLDGAVRQGELARIVMAEHVRSTWRCNALPLDAERKKCMLKLSAPLRKVL
jgi:hypothetical protein